MCRDHAKGCKRLAATSNQDMKRTVCAETSTELKESSVIPFLDSNHASHKFLTHHFHGLGITREFGASLHISNRSSRRAACHDCFAAKSRR